jgi:hypothetical protein
LPTKVLEEETQLIIRLPIKIYFFVPPINCSTPNIVDNIPSIEKIGNTFYDGGLNIVTETGATVTLNNNPIAVLWP